jgi:hypothetical protein
LNLKFKDIIMINFMKTSKPNILGFFIVSSNIFVGGTIHYVNINNGYTKTINSKYMFIK